MTDSDKAPDATPDSAQDGGETESTDARILEAELRRARDQAAELRTKVRAMEAEAAKSAALAEEAANKKAEEQGTWQQRYQETKAEADTIIGRAKQKLLTERLHAYATSKGIPSDVATRLAYPTEGLQITDEFELDGSLSSLDDFLGPFIPSDEPPKRGASPITERPRKETPEPLTGVKAWNAEMRQKLKQDFG